MKFRLIVGLGALAAVSLCAQSVISARAGLIHFMEGTVLLDGQKIEMGKSEFPEAGLNQLLNVGDGRAEVLLNPGSVLRLGQESAVRLLANRLNDTRIALLRGTALIEIDALLDGNRVAVNMRGNNQVQLLKHGLYYFNADTDEIRIYDGKAQVTRDGEIATLTKGRSISLSEGLQVAKFNTKTKGDLYLWSQYRSQAMAMANMSAANSVGPKTKLTSNMWYYDRFNGMFTFLPVSGTIRSPFGWSWYSPSTIWIVYAPRVSYPAYNASNSGAGSSWTGITNTSSGAAASSVAAAPDVAVRSAPAESAPAAAATSGGRSR